MPRAKRRAYKPYLRLPPPFQVDSDLLAFSAGVFAGEGTQTTYTERRRRPAIEIRVKACDKDMVERVSRAWGIKPTPIRTDEPTCDPEASGDRYTAWIAHATGERARQIIKTYREKGLLTKEREIKLKRLEEKHGTEI